MKKSCFYIEKEANRHVITFLFLEALRMALADNPDTTLDVAIKKASVACGMIGTIDALAIAKELQSLGGEADQKSSDSESPSTKKSLGTEYLKWLGDLSPDKLCMLLSGSDLDKARHLYCMQDHRDVAAMAEVYIEQEWNRLQASFEAAMYGFGGGYKGDGASDPGAFDMTADNPDAEQTLKSLGF